MSQQMPPPPGGHQPPPPGGQPPPPGGQPPTPGGQPPYPPQGGYPGGPPPPSPKTKMVAGLLGLFLGAWGVHRFYLGFTNIGIWQIVVTIVTCGIGGLWGVIEGILYLASDDPKWSTDANGNYLAKS